MKMLGVDFGTKRIGLASCDDDGRVAFALGAADAKQSLKQQFSEVLSRHPAELIVVGNPLRLNGSPGVMSEKVAVFAKRIEDWFGVKVVLWDERFTSAQADVAPHGDRASGGRDAAAAALILQSYLDYVNSKSDAL
jgi:putative holliday junction resolvase